MLGTRDDKTYFFLPLKPRLAVVVVHSTEGMDLIQVPAYLALSPTGVPIGTLSSSQTDLPSMLHSFLLCSLVHIVPSSRNALSQFPFPSFHTLLMSELFH